MPNGTACIAYGLQLNLISKGKLVLQSPGLHWRICWWIQWKADRSVCPGCPRPWAQSPKQTTNYKLFLDLNRRRGYQANSCPMIEETGGSRVRTYQDRDSWTEATVGTSAGVGKPEALCGQLWEFQPNLFGTQIYGFPLILLALSHRVCLRSHIKC